MAHERHITHIVPRFSENVAKANTHTHTEQNTMNEKKTVSQASARVSPNKTKNKNNRIRMQRRRKKSTHDRFGLLLMYSQTFNGVHVVFYAQYETIERNSHLWISIIHSCYNIQSVFVFCFIFCFYGFCCIY